MRIVSVKSNDYEKRGDISNIALKVGGKVN